MSRIRVLLAEDHGMLREALREVLEAEPDLEVVDAAADGAEALRLAAELRPDVLVLDLLMPGLTGAAVVRELRADLPDTRIVVLTGSGDREHLRTMVRLGVHGYLLKTGHLANLVAAIRTVHAGGRAFGPEEMEALAEAAGLSRQVEPTGREVEILRLVAEGLRNQEIAERLGIKASTVEYHVRNLFRKLAVQNRTALAHEARRRGWAA